MDGIGDLSGVPAVEVCLRRLDGADAEIEFRISARTRRQRWGVSPLTRPSPPIPAGSDAGPAFGREARSRTGTQISRSPEERWA
jgi:hypothetical protein